MPTYVYRREDGTTFEIDQRITADPLETCPETGQPVERVITGGTGLIFKGSGFYLTDYARQNGSAGDESKSSDNQPQKEASTEKTTSDSGDASTSSKEAA